MKTHVTRGSARDTISDFPIELSIKALQETLSSDDADKIRARSQDVTEASMKLGEAIYKTQQEETKPEGQPKEDDKKEDVVDAEYEEVDNKKAG